MTDATKVSRARNKDATENYQHHSIYNSNLIHLHHHQIRSRLPKMPQSVSFEDSSSSISTGWMHDKHMCQICRQCENRKLRIKQGVVLTGCNPTGLPCSIGHPTAHVPGGQPACPPAALQRRQMPASKTIMAH